MPRTRLELQTDLMVRLDDVNFRRFNSTEINRWINEAIRNVARSTESIRSSVTIPILANTYQYVIAAKVVRIASVEYNDGNGRVYPLEYRDFHSMADVWGARRDRKGSAEWWTTWGSPPALQLVIYPIPPTATGTLTIYYYTMPTDLALTNADDNTQVSIPDGWDDVAVDYAEMLALRAEGDSRWQEAMQLYSQHREELIAASTRFVEEVGMIDTGRSSVPAWLADPYGMG